MRVLVFFDLPMETSEDVRAYTHFRKELIKAGFVMMQFSVYSKIAINPIQAESVSSMVQKICPGKGIVQLMTITEKQFANIKFLAGKPKETVVQTDKRLVII